MTESRNDRRPLDGRRITTTFRCLPSIRSNLQRAADVSGRSLGEEIERIIEAHYAALDTRTIIREEIRAALDDATVFVYRDAAAGMQSAASPHSLNQIHDRSALNGKQ